MSVEVSTPSLIPTLGGHLYTDAAIFRAEQERIFEQMWFCAIRSADLDKPGAWQTVQVGPRERADLRTRKGADPCLL